MDTNVVVNERVRVVSYRGIARDTEGVVAKVATNKAGVAYFVVDSPEEKRYHTFHVADATVVKLP